MGSTVKTFGELDADSRELIQSAIGARKYAYCPYSNFKVGAAFRTKCGRIYSGCNIENAAFTPSSCAERTAIGKAVSEGFLEFVAGAVVAFQEDSFTTPCGVCRQFIKEFTEIDMPIYVAKDEDGAEQKSTDLVLCTSICDLLPHGFKTFKK